MRTRNTPADKSVIGTAVNYASRFPDFNPQNLKISLKIVDASFVNFHILDPQLQYLQAIVALPPRYALEIRDIITVSVTDSSYNRLRE